MTTQILVGDALTVMRSMPANHFHCVVTSPPYFGLRDYGTAQWQGGNAECGHQKGTLVSQRSSLRNDGREHVGPYDGEKTVTAGMPYRDLCGICGATRIDSQIGLEATPEAYVAELVAVFSEVRRVLRDDGTVWLNLGDSYASDTKGGNNNGEGKSTITSGARPHVREAYNNGKGRTARKINHGLKPKDLIGIPWRVAFALQADGWYLRQDIIWSKPNPMPESVTDRCTKAHEYLFLLAKSARYHFDAEAIAEPANYPDNPRNTNGGKYANASMDDPKMRIYGNASRIGASETRNKRSVWKVATQPFSEAHFATFPPALIEPCIKAGCPKDGTVLDPFGGAGTTGLVADRLGRNCTLIELNPKYAAMAAARIIADAPLLASVSGASPAGVAQLAPPPVGDTDQGPGS